MPVSQVLNPKGIIKRNSTNDLPFAPQQPVISAYYNVSTAGQNVINLTFSVDTTSTDIFWLFVDGRKLDIGSGNDYTFSSIAADLTSSQVTLNQALTVGLNIQAFKLGLKKESEFLTDSRFVQLYAAQSVGFQGFVDITTNLVTATTTTGTPAAGTFYSTITGRASIVDLSQDLRARMGIERIPIQNIQLIPTEQGPNGEPIYGVLNDVFGQIRFIGTWSNTIDTNGARPGSSGTANVDSVEITFYGTGLNILAIHDASARTMSYTVDGGSSTTVTYPASGNGILESRNYAPNQVLAVATGLTLGIHTIRVLMTGAVNQTIYGFETLNESSSVTVNSGIGYIQGKKYVSSSQQTFSYSAPVTGTRGGRVIVYQNSDGTLGKAFTAVNASAQSFVFAGTGYAGTAPDHTNEEVVRVYNIREFGAGRSANDDFSLVNNSNGTFNLAFTLEDGTTTLECLNTAVGSVGGADVIAPNASSAEWVFTFVGTGLDIYLTGNGSAFDNHSVTIDGTVVTSTFQGTATAKIQKIVSGLPYGTHTVRLIRLATGNTGIATARFIVYQPKTPALPSGTIQLADYNVPATYVSSASNAKGVNSTGILRKMGSVRETMFTGTWGTMAIDTTTGNVDSGWSTFTITSGSTWRYTFFGTGVEFGTFYQNGAYNQTISLNGSTNLTTGNTSWPAIVTSISQPGTGLSFAGNPATISGTSSAAGHARFRVTGLPLATYTIIFTTNNTSQSNVDTWDVIAPIHSYKSNLYDDLQNTLPTGSNSMSDDRQTTPIKNSLPATKPWSQAIGITSAPSTSSTSMVPVPDMSCTIKTTGGALQISYCVESSQSGTVGSTGTGFQIFVDGSPITPARFDTNVGIGDTIPLGQTLIVPVSAGYHKVDVYWQASSAGTVTATGARRELNVREL